MSASVYSHFLPCLVFTLFSLQYVLIASIADIALITLNGITLPLWNNMWENFVAHLCTGEQSSWGFSFALASQFRNSACSVSSWRNYFPPLCFSSACWFACCGPSSMTLPYLHQIMSCSGFLKLLPRCSTLSQEGLNINLFNESP